MKFVGILGLVLCLVQLSICQKPRIDGDCSRYGKLLAGYGNQCVGIECREGANKPKIIQCDYVNGDMSSCEPGGGKNPNLSFPECCIQAECHVMIEFNLLD